MDDLLPSYESTLERDPWILIAPYLCSEDLCSAALVCRKWHKTFTPCLWGSPASHFGVQNDTVYVVLTRFKRILPYVRPFLRELTHTLHLPPAHAEIYGGPHSEWLRDCLEYLPRLQCLVVEGLPFFDHASLLNLRHSSVRRTTARFNTFPVFSLRLLDAAGCTNATSTGLAEALPHFPDLVSLDLSNTPAAKDEIVLSKLKYLTNLRVLTLKGLGLKDADFSIVARSIGTRVRSLDVSNNHLTDESARLLLENCLKETPVISHASRGALPPVETGGAIGEIDGFESENLVDHLRKKLTNGFTGRLAIEEARDMGITHLYLTLNMMTVEGISGLLRSKRLQVLDVGTLPMSLNSPIVPLFSDGTAHLSLPGVSKLAPILSEYASARLKFLRINYELVTEDCPLDAILSPRAELSGDIGRYDPTGSHELAVAEEPMIELQTTEADIAELPGDYIQPSELPAVPLHDDSHSIPANVNQLGASARNISQSLKIEITPESREIDRDPAHAPEAVLVDTPITPMDHSNHENNHENHLWIEANCLSPNTISSTPGSIGFTSTQGGRRSRHNSTHFIEDRRAGLEFRQSQENRFHPGMLPRVHTLVLTDVPTTTTSSEMINRLIQFIKDASEEAYIAKQRAKHTYVLPPGRSRTLAEQEYARSLFALRRIVLEMAPPRAAPKKKSTSWRAYPSKSSTEDADSEAFWEAATYDFSFFDDEECGLPSVEPGRTLPLAAMSGLELAPQSSAAELRIEKVHVSSNIGIDVIQAIGNFRKERKAAHINLAQLGQIDPEVEGYWPGDITIIRKSAHADMGELDCYGNRYEAGWHYR